jgi:hypothetical protein
MQTLSSRLVGLLGATFFIVNCSGVGFTPREVSDANAGSGSPGNEDSGIGMPGTNDQFLQYSQSINVGANSDVDILFVVDNSGSMQQEQSELANRISGFLGVIQDLNWQIAMTTTDPRSGNVVRDDNNIQRSWGDGQFRPFGSDDGDQFILKRSEHSASEAQALLSQAINVGIRGSGNERGINAVYRAIERRQQSSAHDQFFRPNASLAVVLISDEDECSNYSCPDLLESSPMGLVSLVTESFGPNKPFNFHSIIWIPGDSGCNTGYHQGPTYMQMSTLAGGVVGSICSSNYTSLLTNIGERVIELVESTQLNCSPADINNDGKADLFITLDGGHTLAASDFTINGNRVNFKDPLPEGQHIVTYYCAKDTGDGLAQ